MNTSRVGFVLAEHRPQRQDWRPPVVPTGLRAPQAQSTSKRDAKPAGAAVIDIFRKWWIPEFTAALSRAA